MAASHFKYVLGVCALTAALGLCLAPAALSDAGPGVVLHIGDQTKVVPPRLFQPDVPRHQATLRGEKKTKQLTLPDAMSIATLLRAAQIDPNAIGFLRITRPRDGTFGYLSKDEILAPKFKDGPAVVWLQGDITRFFRPQRNDQDQNAADNIATQGGAPLVVSAHTGNVLAVKAKADPATTHENETVSFSATATNEQKGEDLSYSWHFGDGSKASGQSVEHKYDTSGRYNAFVVVSGSKDSGGSSETLAITVGKPPSGTSGSPGGSGNSNTAPSTGTGTGGGGSSGSLPPSTTPPQVNTPQLAPKPLTSIPPVEPGTARVSGILLASSEPLPPGSLLRSPGSPALASTGSTPSREVPIVAGAAVLLLGLGAFMEGGRRRIRIRIPKPWRR